MSHPRHPNSKNKAPPASHAASPQAAMATKLSVLSQNAPSYPNALWYPLVITLVPSSELRPPIFGCDQPFGRWAFTSTAAPSTTTSASQTAALWHIARVANERSVGQISGVPVSGNFHVRTVLVRPNSESTATHCFFGPCGAIHAR